MSSAGLARRRRVVAAKVESTEGTYASPALSDADFRVLNPTFSITPLVFPREVVQESFTPLPPKVAGVSQVEISFGIELAGDTANGNAASSADFTTPGWAKLLESCGMRQYQVYAGQITSSAIVGGPFQDGETVTSSGGPAGTSTCVGDMHTGQGLIFLEGGTASDYVSAETLTGSTSSATCVLSANLTTGERLAWRPESDITLANVPTLSIDLYRDGKIVRAKGCRGTFQIVCEHGNSVKVNFTFRGVLHAEEDQALISPTYSSEIPPSYIGVDLTLTDNQVDTNLMEAATHNAMTIDLGNTLVVREDSSSTSGFLCGIITGRAGTVTMNPDELTDADSNSADLYARLEAGDPMAVNWSMFGTPLVGNSFTVRMPGVVFESISDDDRDGIEVAGITGQLTSGIYPDGNNGQDSELLIFNH